MLTQTVNVDASGNTVISGTVTATGPATDAQLRATPLPISGSVTTGGLTDTQIRATPLPISGTVVTGGLTDAQIRATPLPISGTVTTTAVTSATGTLTSVAASATSVSVIASNVNRKGFAIYNDSTAICRIAFSATASATAFTVLLQPNSFYENNTLYTGIVSAIWVSAAGAARVTELT